MKFYNVAFDLDGTLIDVSKRDYAVYTDILREKGYVPVEFEDYWSLRKNKTNIFDILELSTNDTAFHIFFLEERKNRIERSDYLNLDKVFDHVFEVLSILKEKYLLSLVTLRNNVEITHSQIQRIGLLKYFDDVKIIQGVKYDAYCQIPYLKAIIGDTENDVLPGIKLSVLSIGVTTGIRNKIQLEKLQPQFIVEDIKEILNIIK